ncbi:unnamed protein product, partial [Ectocarpus fasciculatus]
YARPQLPLLLLADRHIRHREFEQRPFKMAERRLPGGQPRVRDREASLHRGHRDWDNNHRRVLS